MSFIVAFFTDTSIELMSGAKSREWVHHNAAFGGRRKVVSPRLEVGTSHLFAFGSTGNFQLGKSRRLTESIYFVLN